MLAQEPDAGHSNAAYGCAGGISAVRQGDRTGRGDAKAAAGSPPGEIVRTGELRMIVDTSRRATASIACLKAAGVTTVIRYYARETRMTEKRLIREEAAALVAGGLNVAVVFQSAGNNAGCFSAEIGAADAAYAHRYAMAQIGQPAGSAIYFAVDYAPRGDDMGKRIIPHFRAIGRAFSAEGSRYRVGVYGNGRVCASVRNSGLAEFAWLSNQPGDTSFDDWTLRQGGASVLCGLAFDINALAAGVADFGAFAALGGSV